MKIKPDKIATWTLTAIVSVTFYVILVMGTWYGKQFPNATPWAHWLGWVFAVIGTIIISLIFGLSTFGRLWIEKITLSKKESRQNVLKTYKHTPWYKFFWSYPITIFILYTYFHMGWYVLFGLCCINMVLYTISYYTLTDFVKKSLKVAKVVETE